MTGISRLFPSFNSPTFTKNDSRTPREIFLPKTETMITLPSAGCKRVQVSYVDRAGEIGASSASMARIQ
jgi:hypothetical protein